MQMMVSAVATASRRMDIGFISLSTFARGTAICTILKLIVRLSHVDAGDPATHIAFFKIQTSRVRLSSSRSYVLLLSNFWHLIILIYLFSFMLFILIVSVQRFSVPRSTVRCWLLHTPYIFRVPSTLEYSFVQLIFPLLFVSHKTAYAKFTCKILKSYCSHCLHDVSCNVFKRRR